MLQKKYISFFLLLLMAATASAQKAERDFIRKGNRFLTDRVSLVEAVNYRKDLETNPQCLIWGIHWLSRINCKRLWNNMLPLQK